MASMFPEGMMPPPDPMAAPMDPGMGMMPPDVGMMPPNTGMAPPPEAPAGPELGAQTAEDWLKLAIYAAQQAADADETDDIDMAAVFKGIAVFQNLLADFQKGNEALMGGGPATKALGRAYGG